MISRCEQMYEDVSERLLQEGKETLYEDERLFINMINRLNEQALEIEDAPAQGRRSKQAKVTIASLSSNQPESRAISTLRSLVEENEARVTARVKDSYTGEGSDDDDDKEQKRGVKKLDSSSLPDTKRMKRDP